MSEVRETGDGRVTVRLVSVLGADDAAEGRLAPSEFVVAGHTVREALLAVEELVPSIKGRLVAGDGTLNPSLCLWLEGRGSLSHDTSVRLEPGATLIVGPVVTGG